MQQRLKKLSLSLLTVVLMLMTCEGATRLLSRVPRDVSERHPVIGRRFRPNMSEHVYNVEADAPILISTNQYGFRGSRETAQEKDPNVRRVAILGDSYTASMALPEEKTFCAQLQKMATDSCRGKTKWEVMNFGIPGSGTGQELALYRNLIRDLEIDDVIVAFGNATDLRDNSPELSTNPIIQFSLNEDGSISQIPQSARRVRFSNLLNEYSQFYTWQKMKLSALKRQIQAETKMDRGRQLIYASEEPQAYSNAWQLTSAILRTFRDECHHDGVRFAVTAVPSAYQVYPDYFESLAAKGEPNQSLDPKHPDKRLAAICSDLSIPFLSLTEGFVAHAPSGSCELEAEQLFFDGKGHLNEKGSRLAGEELSRWLTQPRLAGLPPEYR